MADDWKSPNFRSSIVARIGQMMNQGLMSASNPRTNPQNLENHIFSKSSSKEEYLQYASKLINHFRNQIAQNQSKQMQQQQPHKQEVEMGGGGGPQNMIPDPINALQNLASQGSRPVNAGIPGPGNQMQQGLPMQGGPNNINASNLLQTLNQQRPGQQPPPNQQMQGMRGQMVGQPMMNVGPNQMNMNNMNMMGQQQPQQQPNQMQMQNQMGGGGMNQMQMNQMNMNQMNPMMNRMGNQPNMNVGPGMGPNQIQMQNNMGNMPNQGPGMMPNAGIVPQVQQGGNNMQQMMNMQQKQQANMNMQQGNIYRVNPQAGQNFLPQSPSQNVPSPAQQMPSQPPQIPNPQMIPSPALVPTSSPQMPQMMANQRVMMQSPSQPLNTPGQPAQSPYNAQEDIIYREKYKQLTKYIDPLQKMIAKMETDDSEKIAKINRLLEILLNPQQRIPLETLLKCEKALERMDILHIAPSNKHHFLETVNTVLQTPTGHHTLYRTFHPSFESLFGTDIQMSSIPKKRSMPVEESQETPHVLQGEIARLDQKFKVTLDPATQNQNKTLTLNCCLDDKCLPWVPPICVTIPENYPFISPTCTLNKQEYTATPFLSSVEKSLASRIGKLPKLHSLSHILDTWEMSVRQACSPTSSALTAEDALADILAF